MKQLYARLLPNGNNVVIECVVNNCKNNSSLCCGQSKLASLMNLEYYFRYFTFGNVLENIGNMYIEMAIHTKHTDSITKHAYMHMRNIYNTRIHLLYVDFYDTT